MIVAKWTIDARFGHKDSVTESLKGWLEQFGPKLGWNADNTRMTAGSLGANESTICCEVTLDSIHDLHKCFETLQTMPDHHTWAKKLEPHVVSGSNAWTVYRVL